MDLRASESTIDEPYSALDIQKPPELTKKVPKTTGQHRKLSKIAPNSLEIRGIDTKWVPEHQKPP